MSTERERLIEAIRETPDDDAPRLVMADWFADQGGPENEARADLIRTQIDRARLPELLPPLDGMTDVRDW